MNLSQLSARANQCTNTSCSTSSASVREPRRSFSGSGGGGRHEHRKAPKTRPNRLGPDASPRFSTSILRGCNHIDPATSTFYYAGGAFFARSLKPTGMNIATMIPRKRPLPATSARTTGRRAWSRCSPTTPPARLCYCRFNRRKRTTHRTCRHATPLAAARKSCQFIFSSPSTASSLSVAVILRPLRPIADGLIYHSLNRGTIAPRSSPPRRTISPSSPPWHRRVAVLASPAAVTPSVTPTGSVGCTHS